MAPGAHGRAGPRPAPGRASAGPWPSAGSRRSTPGTRRGEGLAAPLVLLPADEANGLEFDSVVVVEPALIAAGEAVGREGPPAGRPPGGCGPSTWPSPGPPAAWRSCRRDRCRPVWRWPERPPPATPRGPPWSTAQAARTEVTGPSGGRGPTRMLASRGPRSTRKYAVSQAISVDQPAKPRRVVHDRPPMLAIGVMIWLGSELMFFSGLFAAFFSIRANDHPWPPVGHPPRHLQAGIFTAILVSSSFTMQKAVFAEERYNRRGGPDLDRVHAHPRRALPRQPGLRVGHPGHPSGHQRLRLALLHHDRASTASTCSSAWWP